MSDHTAAPHLTESGDATAQASPGRRAAALALVVLAVGASCKDDPTQPRPETQQVAVKSLTDGHSIQGSSATLTRAATGLNVIVETNELEPNESVDLFWAIFDDPSACENPNALTGAPCTPADLFIEETQASLHFVGTLTADASGKLSYPASLATGNTDACVGDPFPCRGLKNPFDAEVHSAMFAPGGGPGRQAAQFFR